jgi:hypothetical protein
VDEIVDTSMLARRGESQKRCRARCFQKAEHGFRLTVVSDANYQGLLGAAVSDTLARRDRTHKPKRR